LASRRTAADQSTRATFVVGTVIAGLGFGLFQTPNNRILPLSAPKARCGGAGPMLGTARLGLNVCYPLCERQKLSISSRPRPCRPLGVQERRLSRKRQ
jgi:hypothetical protein